MQLGAFSVSLAVKDIKGPCLFAGDGAVTYKNIIQNNMSQAAVFAPESQNMIRASSVAAISLKRFEKGDTDNVDTFVPYCFIMISASIFISHYLLIFI